MPYDIAEKELYNRAFFNFHFEGNLINAVFEIYDEPGHDYMFIVFTEDGSSLDNLGCTTFTEPLSEILYRFDNGKQLNYKVIITC